MNVSNKVLAGSLGAATLLSVAGVAFAQSGGASSVSSLLGNRPTPSQACVQAMATMADAHLANFDAMMATEKELTESRRDALRAAAAIADDTARGEALMAMHEEMRAAKGEEMTPPAEITAAMEAIRTACGDTMMFHGGRHEKMKMMGGMGGMKFMHKIHMDDGAKDPAGSSAATVQ